MYQTTLPSVETVFLDVFVVISGIEERDRTVCPGQPLLMPCVRALRRMSGAKHDIPPRTEPVPEDFKGRNCPSRSVCSCTWGGFPYTLADGLPPPMGCHSISFLAYREVLLTSVQGTIRHGEDCEHGQEVFRARQTQALCRHAWDHYQRMALLAP